MAVHCNMRSQFSLLHGALDQLMYSLNCPLTDRWLSYGKAMEIWWFHVVSTCFKHQNDRDMMGDYEGRWVTIGVMNLVW